ncbi:MAG: type II methionyl aminopeptidase [archaeon]
MMDEIIKAGKISHDALEYACSLVRVGAKMRDVAEKTEEFIIEKGGKPAFPVNIAVNNVAAHFTPAANDDIVFTENDMVKVDVGAHVNGFIGDNARTIDLTNENGKLVEASEKALDNAVACVKPGINSVEASKAIQKTIESFGFRPVRNLSGHVMTQYELHSGESLQNVATNGFTLEEDMLIAIEPFASTGNGYVREDARTEIFSFETVSPTRSKTAREVASFAEREYSSLPFAERWLAKRFNDPFALKIALRELVKNASFKAYPILKDDKNSLVSQAEVTVLVTKDGCEITTK